MILGCLTFTSSATLFFQDIKTLEFWVEAGMIAEFQAGIPRLQPGSPVIYLGEIDQKVIRTKKPKSFSVLDDATIVFDEPPEKIEYAVARVFATKGLGYVLKLKLKAFDEAG